MIGSGKIWIEECLSLTGIFIVIFIDNIWNCIQKENQRDVRLRQNSIFDFKLVFSDKIYSINLTSLTTASSIYNTLRHWHFITSWSWWSILINILQILHSIWIDGHQRFANYKIWRVTKLILEFSVAIKSCSNIEMNGDCYVIRNKYYVTSLALSAWSRY